MKINSVTACYTHCHKPALFGLGYDSVQWLNMHRRFGLNVYTYDEGSIFFLKYQDQTSCRYTPNCEPTLVRRGYGCAGKIKFLMEAVEIAADLKIVLCFNINFLSDFFFIKLIK